MSATSATAQTSLLLTRLPPELLPLILSHLPLASVVLASQTCHTLRSHVLTSPLAWVGPLARSAQTAGYHLRLSPGPHTTREESEVERDTLGGLMCGVVPPRAWRELLPVLARVFVLYEMQLPTLKDDEWKVSSALGWCRWRAGAARCRARVRAPVAPTAAPGDRGRARADHRSLSRTR